MCKLLPQRPIHISCPTVLFEVWLCHFSPAERHSLFFSCSLRHFSISCFNYRITILLSKRNALEYKSREFSSRDVAAAASKISPRFRWTRKLLNHLRKFLIRQHNTPMHSVSFPQLFNNLISEVKLNMFLWLAFFNFSHFYQCSTSTMD